MSDVKPLRVTCRKCNKRKAASQFPKHYSKFKKNGLSSWCRHCHMAANRAYWQRRKARIEAENSAALDKLGGMK